LPPAVSETKGKEEKKEEERVKQPQAILVGQPKVHAKGEATVPATTSATAKASTPPS